jgi:hypothetical protein
MELKAHTDPVHDIERLYAAQRIHGTRAKLRQASDKELSVGLTEELEQAINSVASSPARSPARSAERPL